MRFLVMGFCFFAQFLNAAPLDLVSSLPGYGKLKQTQYSGYVSANPQPCSTIQCKDEPGLFYWFVKTNAADAEHKPIILWSNGGPGSSSLYGFFLENGPYVINPDLSLKDQTHAWSNFANYLAIDHPLSVGLSFGSKQDVPNNLAQGIDQYYYALLHFLRQHPEYQDNKIYLSGESYAGTYLPELAAKILVENKQHSENYINLAGLIIISGWVDPLLQQSQDANYAYYHGLIDHTQKQKIDQLYQQCATAIQAHHPTTVHANEVCGQVAATIVKFSGIYDANIALKQAPPHDDLIKYLDQPSVRKALHAKTQGGFADFSDVIGATYEAGEQDSYLSTYNKLLAEGIPILFFTGLNDEKDSNFLGARAWIEKLSWPEKMHYQHAPMLQWRDKNDRSLLGYSKEGGGFRWMTVLNAGHMIPIDQPRMDQAVEEFLRLTSTTKDTRYKSKQGSHT